MSTDIQKSLLTTENEYHILIMKIGSERTHHFHSLLIMNINIVSRGGD